MFDEDWTYYRCCCFVQWRWTVGEGEWGAVAMVQGHCSSLRGQSQCCFACCRRLANVAVMVAQDGHCEHMGTAVDRALYPIGQRGCNDGTQFTQTTYSTWVNTWQEGSIVQHGHIDSNSSQRESIRSLAPLSCRNHRENVYSFDMQSQCLCRGNQCVLGCFFDYCLDRSGAGTKVPCTAPSRVGTWDPIGVKYHRRRPRWCACSNMSIARMITILGWMKHHWEARFLVFLFLSFVIRQAV